MEDLLDTLPVSPECGCNTQEVSGRERWCGDVQVHCLGVGPDARPFRPIDILHDLVLDIAEDIVACFVFGLADVGADL